MFTRFEWRHKVGLAKIAGLSMFGVAAGLALAPAAAGLGAIAAVAGAAAVGFSVAAEAFDTGHPCRGQRVAFAAVMGVAGGAFGGLLSEGGMATAGAVAPGSAYVAEKIHWSC